MLYEERSNTLGCFAVIPLRGFRETQLPSQMCDGPRSKGSERMKRLSKKLVAVLAVLVCLAPFSLGDKPRENACRPGRRCQQVPEGGSAAIYLLGAGLTCLGAMVLRSRGGAQQS